jgi:signal transduction histidine kinase
MGNLDIVSTRSTTHLDDASYLRQVVAAREDERARVARDLHDRLGPQLTALRLVLEQHQVDARGTIDRALALVREIDEELDHMAWELRTSALDRDGLAASLRQLVQRLTDCAAFEADCRCDVRCDQLPQDQQVTIYRIAQEALRNVLKHAHAVHVYVRAEVREDCFALIVQDDGIGFEPSRYSMSGSGLIGAREHAGLIGAVLHVESSPGHGTTVYLRIPLGNPRMWRRAFSRALGSAAADTGLRKRVG